MKTFSNTFSGAVRAIQRISRPIRWPVVFYCFVALLTALSLCPIWMNRLLPMQDYPQHLFLSHIIATYDDPSFNWKQHYSVDLGLRPYHLWYLVMKPLSMLYGVETAGKLIFSLHILSLSALVHMSRRICAQDTLPWGALTLYPFAFNQIYFMGFPNFIISLPVLYLAALDLEESTIMEPGPWRRLLHLAYVIFLYLSHPYALLVYICLAIATAACCMTGTKKILSMLSPATGAAALLTIWYILQHGPSTAPNPYLWQITWLPVAYSAVFYTLMFTGMRLTNGPDILSICAWTAIMFTAYAAWRVQDRPGVSIKVPLALFIACLTGYFILPAWFGYYSYFNLRLAPVSYFMLALLLAHIAIKPRAGIIIAGLALILVASSLLTQTKVSRSAEEISPLFRLTDKNALVLPLIFNSESSVLEPVFYYQFHLHQISYYHITPGGGTNPALFRNAMIPVQYRRDINLPFPEHPSRFQWQIHGRPYDYFILRSAPADFSRQMRTHADFIARSGPWELFRNKK